MATCPRCNSAVQKRKLLLLTNFNSIACQVCGSRLRIKKRVLSSAIGAAGVPVGILFGFLLFRLSLSGNIIHIVLVVAAFLLTSFALIVLCFKVVKVELENPNVSIPPPPPPPT